MAKKKQDCMGRDMNEKDLVVVSYSGKMELGVVLNNTIRTLNSIEKAIGRKKCYILSNPTKEELKVKNEIVDKFDKFQQNNLKEQKSKGKPNYGTLPGGIYTTDEGSVYIYLGNISVTDYDSDNIILRKRSGNAYYLAAYSTFTANNVNNVSFDDIFHIYGTYDGLQFNKGFKRINGLSGINENFKYVSKICGIYDLPFNKYTNGKREIGKRIIKENK